MGNDVASATDAIRQLHYVKEYAGGVVAAHVENVNEAMVRAGDGGVLQEAAIFPFERRPVGKSVFLWKPMITKQVLAITLSVPDRDGRRDR